MSRRKRYTRNLGRTPKAPLDPRTTVEWIRFEHDTEPYGVFSYIDDAAEALRTELLAELEGLRDWFGDNLDAPHDAASERFWFRAEATEHVTRARRLSAIVSEAGFPIVERRALRVPGKVRWEDPHQVMVVMYRDAPRPSTR